MANIKRRKENKEAAARLKASGIPPIMAKLYASRGVRDLEDLSTELNDLPDWQRLKNIEAAAELIGSHIEQGKHIIILSDYDADGATGCAVGVRGLRELGGKVDFVIPLRHEHGYGLTPDIVPQILAAHPDLVITVDNGISSVPGIAKLREKGIPVVVTDHHLAPESLPNANVIVDPNQPGCEYPSKAIAGVGVMYFTLHAVRAYLTQSGWFASRRMDPPDLLPLLPIVALGTVADVVPLDRTNRIMVAQGLDRFHEGDVPPGLASLAAVAKRKLPQMVAQDFGFYLGPRLNAAGRLADMSIGVNCLLGEDSDQTDALAQQLEDLNTERKQVEQATQAEAARAILEQLGEVTNGHSISVDGPWNHGVVGIVAGRLKEKHVRPTFVFGQDTDPAKLKGSGRSIPEYHLRDALARIANRYPGIMLGFGGHAMAAGVGILKENVATFHRALEEDAAEQLADHNFEGIIESDGELSGAQRSARTAELLATQVWGQTFPEPVFDGEFIVQDAKPMGADKTHLRLTITDGAISQQAVWFNALKDGPIDLSGPQRFAYRLSLNEWKGQRALQLMIVDRGQLV